MPRKELGRIEEFLTRTIENDDRVTPVAAVIAGVVLMNYLTDDAARTRVYELREKKDRIRDILLRRERCTSKIDAVVEEVWRFLDVVTQIAQREPINIVRYIAGGSQFSKKDEKMVVEMYRGTARADIFKMGLRAIILEAWGISGWREIMYEYNELDEMEIWGRMKYCWIAPIGDTPRMVMEILGSLYL